MPDKRVSYFYEPTVGAYEYSSSHPMRPLRIKMTHELVLNYNLHEKMNVITPRQATFEEISAFHHKEYIQFIKQASSIKIQKKSGDFKEKFKKFNFNDDSPQFKGMYEFCKKTAGGTLCCAQQINEGRADIAINWSGGLHHAKRTEASGFCYTNDIVLGILELLKYNKRVMYIDIDVHHGDGVEEAFYTSDRVMSVSFHKYGDFFPGTGALKDKGLFRGENYSVNVPLDAGIDDFSYKLVFKQVMEECIGKFQPSVIVLQSGADSLSGDRLGVFNLTLDGHSSCLAYLKSKNIPLVVLGGGGYTIRNVARAWAYETSVACGVEIDRNIPHNEFYSHYGPDFKIDVPESDMTNRNTKKDLEKIVRDVHENLRNISSAPNVELQYLPSHLIKMESESLDAETESETDY